MSITLKKDQWKVKDPSTGTYRGSAIFSTTLPEDAAQIVEDASEALDVQQVRAQKIVNDAQNAVNGINGLKETMIASIASVADYGTDTTLTTPHMAADAKAVGDALAKKAHAIYDTTSGDIASFHDGADGLLIKNLTIAIELVQDLHGYDFPWPAGGRKNKFTTDGEATGQFIDDNGGINFFPGWTTSYYIPVLPSTQYTFNPNTTEGGTAKHIYYNTNKEFISSINSGPQTFTTPSNCAFMRFSYRETSTNIQLELGSTATAYAPYSNICPISGWTGCNISHSGADTSDPTVIPISWQTEAGTVYGGTLDVTTGVLRVDRAMVNLASIMTGYTESYFYGFISDKANGEMNLLTSCYKTVNGSVSSMPNGSIKGQATGRNIYVVDNRATDLSTLQSLLSGQTIVYELAQPTSVPLTPTEVETLLGQNNIWADTGAVINCEYPCDTKLYIERLTAPEDDDMIADANIASGKYFIINNNLYLSTTAILAGDPIKPGTNCTLTNLAAALNALNS